MDFERFESEWFFEAMQKCGISIEEAIKACQLFSQSLLGPETGAEAVNPNSKTDLEIFEQNGSNKEKPKIYFIEKIEII